MNKLSNIPREQQDFSGAYSYKEEAEKSNTIKYLHPDLYEKEKQARPENEKLWKIGGVIVKETGEND